MNMMHIHLPTYTYRFMFRERKFDFIVHFKALQSLAVITLLRVSSWEIAYLADNFIRPTCVIAKTLDTVANVEVPTKSHASVDLIEN